MIDTKKIHAKSMFTQGNAFLSKKILEVKSYRPDWSNADITNYVFETFGRAEAKRIQNELNLMGGNVVVTCP